VDGRRACCAVIEFVVKIKDEIHQLVTVDQPMFDFALERACGVKVQE
jgi:hypothetical protein